MAEGESNLSVQLFVELREKFPHVPELCLQNMLKQFSNNREKCLETLNKEFSSSTSSSSMSSSSPSHPNNNHQQVGNSWINIDTSSSASYSTNANKPWSPQKMNKSEMKPNLNPDFGPFIKSSSDSSTIPNINCQSSPVMQIAVHHITTSKPDSPNTHVFCKSPSNSSSSSPNNGNQWNWPMSQQKSHKVHITPTSSAPTQHFAKANLYIDTPNRNVTNHQTVINPSGVGSSGTTCVISPNPRLQPPMVRPSQLITIHSTQPGSQSGGVYSPQPGSQSGGMYSPQPGFSGHGVTDPFTHLSSSANSASWISDVNPGFSSPQLCIPVQVQPTTSSPSTLHHVSSTTYQTMPLPQQNISSSTTSSLIHYPARPGNTSSGQPGNCTSPESMKNPTANHMPLLQPVGNPNDNIHKPHTRNGSLQEDTDYNNALLTHQRKRYNKLKEDFSNLAAQCDDLEQEIVKLDNNKKMGPSKIPFPTEIDVMKLQNSTESLRLEVEKLCMDLDVQSNGLKPVKIIDPLDPQHFYKNMNTGQSGSIFATPQSPQGWNIPPPRPPRYQPDTHPPPESELVEDSWNCSECTYMNNQFLDKCEMCEFPRKHKDGANITFALQDKTKTFIYQDTYYTYLKKAGECTGQKHNVNLKNKKQAN